jgi:hypothetical protein
MRGGIKRERSWSVSWLRIRVFQGVLEGKIDEFDANAVIAGLVLVYELSDSGIEK